MATQADLFWHYPFRCHFGHFAFRHFGDATDFAKSRTWMRFA